MNPLLKHHYENIATDNAVTNEDGSLSTVKSSIVNINGKEMLIPTVWGGEILDGDRLNEAIDNAFDSNIEWPTEEGKDAVNKLRSLEVDVHKQMRPVTRKNAANELIQDADKNRTLEQRYAPIKKGYLDTSYGPIELKEINKEDLLDTNEESDKNSNPSNNNFLKEMQEKFSIGNFSVIPKLEGAEKGVNFKLEYAKGGKIMATQSEEQQMSMLLEGGGFNDQGGTVDPVSGNEVPIGNTQEGVRDDVPIMASEREYVVDAATVNYFGVQKYNDEKKAAAVGYQQMEQDGLLGQPTQGSTLDSNEETPFTIADLDIADEEGKPLMMAEGGTVSTRRKLNTSLDDNVGTNPPTERRPQPTFGDSMGGNGGFTFEMYTHPDGRNMMVPFMNGIPMFSIPEGFVLTDPNAPVETPVANTTVTPAEVVKPVEPFDYGGEIDQFGDPASSNAGLKGLADATISSASLATGGRKASSVESFVINSTPYQNKMTRALQKAGIPVPTNADEKFRQYTLMQLEKQMNSMVTGSPVYNNLADALANTREYTKDAKGDTVPSDQHPSRKTTINPNSKFYNKTPTPTTIDKKTDEVEKEVNEVGAYTGEVTGRPGSGGSGAYTGEVTGRPGSGGAAAAANAAAAAAEGGYDGPDGGDVGGDWGGGNDGGWGGDSGDGGNWGGWNKGGLAGKKPKKKMKTYKKGGLATSKKQLNMTSYSSPYQHRLRWPQ